MVYQETSLVPTMTAAPNVELGNEELLTRFRTLNIQAQQPLQSPNFQVDPVVPIALLGTAKRQMVEIARAVYNKARIMIFDEPTACLTPEETVHFFHLVRNLRSQGVGIIYISHAIPEDLRPRDRTARRQARHHGQDRRHDPRQAGAPYGRPRNHPDPLRQARHCVRRSQIARREGADSRERHHWEHSQEHVVLATGEVVGVAGLIGSGRTEIAKIVYGALRRNLINGGITYITEDRKPNGFFETMVVDDNIYVGKLATRAGWRLLRSRQERDKLARYWVERLKISALQRKARIVEPSGGNQQKVMVAKSLAQDPSIIIFDEPTRGGGRRTDPRDPCPDPKTCR
jgi:ABC-type sugar transport system ATPase subunit